MLDSPNARALRASLEAMHLPAFAVDRVDEHAFVITGANSAIETIAGIGPDACRNAPMRDLFRLQDTDDLEERLDWSLSTGQPLRYARCIRTVQSETCLWTSFIPLSCACGPRHRLLGHAHAARREVVLRADAPLLDEVAYLLMMSSSPLYKLLNAVQARKAKGAGASDDLQFCALIEDLCLDAIDSARRTREALQSATTADPEPAEEPMASELVRVMAEMTARQPLR